MAKEKSDSLFQLVKSLRKSEKRYFKLHMGRHGNSDDKKIMRLFDCIDKQQTFNDEEIIPKEPSIKPAQLSNLKAHLYNKVLQSIRLYNLSANKDIQIREYVDYAQILFNRCLYRQCAKILQKAKKQAINNDNLELMLEILKWEKQVVAQLIDTNNQKKVNDIINEVQDVNNRINNINSLSNLLVKLNAWYVKTGFIRTKKDFEAIKSYFEQNLPQYNEAELSFNEKLNLFNAHVAYYFFIQDFESAYRYAQKWVQLFEDNPGFKSVRTAMFIRGLNNLLIAQSKLFKYHEFVATCTTLKNIPYLPGIKLTENLQMMLFKYNTIHDINKHFMTGDFSDGISLVTQIQKELDHFVDKLGKHSTIIFYYKIACMYFGNGNQQMTTRWLQKIINEQHVDLRQDIHCFARILNLISHYELGNTDVIDYYIKSTYRFLLKKDDLHNFQKYILNFLKQLNKETTETELIQRFKKLREQLLTLVDSPFEKRAFNYFDIISWLESKIEKRTVKEVIQEKAARKIEKQAPKNVNGGLKKEDESYKAEVFQVER